MQFGSGSTVTMTPTSPAADPYPATVDESGKMTTPDGVYDYHAGPPEDYRRQDPGDPPGDWHTIEFDSDGGYKRFMYPASTMTKVHVQTGTWTAVG